MFYVTAHEMAHQWWGHQVVGVGVQGQTLIMESLSQYSALMVMEKEYGREHMRRSGVTSWIVTCEAAAANSASA